MRVQRKSTESLIQYDILIVDILTGWSE
jgi:hypothetical protein